MAVAIKVGKVGQRSQEFILENGTGAELTAALKAEGVETTGYSLRYGADVVADGTRLPNGAIVTLTPQVKGGAR